MAETSADGNAVRLIAGGATLLAGAVLADSGLEHYRGSFHDPFMVVPLIAATASLAVNGSQAARLGQSGGSSAVGALVHGAASAAGLAGLGFHIYNISRQVGGFNMLNLFYAAPIGAPVALTLAGTIGAAAHTLANGQERLGPIPIASGRVLAGYAAIGIVGTVGEAALLHFRGAYHDPFMWAPIVVPPLAALSLARDAIGGEPRTVTTVLLAATAALGIIGVGFHMYGVSRNMGGWRNWRQNILAGPPIPAPPAFTGLALVGIGALMLMRRRRG